MSTEIDLRADYAQARRAAYPEIGDQLDAIHKVLSAMIDGEPIPTDARQLLEEVWRVKAIYPKPTES